jgi:hypothetical protein
MARTVELIFNWWSSFTRMVTGCKHARRLRWVLFQHGIARQRARPDPAFAIEPAWRSEENRSTTSGISARTKGQADAEQFAD